MQTLKQLKLTWPTTGEKIAKLDIFNPLILLQQLVTKDFTIFRTEMFGAGTFSILLLQLPETTSTVEMVSHLSKNKDSVTKALSYRNSTKEAANQTTEPTISKVAQAISIYLNSIQAISFQKYLFISSTYTIFHL